MTLHKPTCPYYHDIRLPECTCFPTPHAPVQTYITRHLSTPPKPLQDAIQSTRVIRRAISRSKHSLDETYEAPGKEKHVHFHPSSPSRQRLQLTSPENYESPREITRRRLTIPTTLKPPPPPTQTPDLPTIYILTFATDTYPLTPQTINYLLATQLPHRQTQHSTHTPPLPTPPPIPHLYTLPCHSFPPPPTPLLPLYSGLTPLIQDIVLSHPPARRAVQIAIKRLLDEGRRGVRECCMSVCCHAGTHRSVAVGERIAQGVKREVGRGVGGWDGGVRVVVRHLCRVRGVGEGW